MNDVEHRLRALELAGRLEQQLKTRTVVTLGHNGHSLIQIDVMDVYAAIASLREQANA